MKRYVADRKELYEDINKGIINDTKITELTRNMSDIIGRGRGETEEELYEDYRKLFQPKPNETVDIGRTARLVETRKIRPRPELDKFLPPDEEMVRQRKKEREEKKIAQRKAERDKKIVKIVAGVMIISMLASYGAAEYKHMKFQEEANAKQNEIVQVIDAGEHNSVLVGVDLVEYSDGTYLFRDQDGDYFAKASNRDHSIDANELGHVINDSKHL